MEINAITTVDWSNPLALVDKHALADRHNRSARSVERDIQEGKGPRHLKVGRKVLFRVQDVLEWEEERLFTSTAEAKAAKDREASEIARRYVEADEIKAGRRRRERKGAEK